MHMKEGKRANLSPIRLLQDQILDLDRQVLAWHRSSDVSKVLATIRGIGPLTISGPIWARCMELERSTG